MDAFSKLFKDKPKERPHFRNFVVEVREDKTAKRYQFSFKANQSQIEAEYEDLILSAKEALDEMLRKAMGVD